MTCNGTDSLFGPASQLVDITEFLNSADRVTQTDGECDVAEELELECSVSDIRDTLTKTWNDPTSSAHLMKNHEITLTALRDSASTPPQPIQANTLQKVIDNVTLKCFRLDTESVLFMRASKNADYNASSSMKRPLNVDSEAPGKAIVTISIHDRLAWGQSYVTRTSQHAFLCDQTLQDLYDSVPCVSRHILAEGPSQDPRLGCVIILEGRAYSGPAGGEDYADKLATHLECFSRTAIIKASTTMKETKFSSLSVRMNEPYWLLHAGNCEHFIVFNQIRLIHPSDPPSDYPVTLHVTPALLDLCRACNKAPAVWSVVGDERLGESPCHMCERCWDTMGPRQVVTGVPTMSAGNIPILVLNLEP